MEEYCLGVESLGRCAASAAPLVSLGEALVVAVLLLASYRYGGRIAQMRWTSRGLTQRTLVVVACVAVALAAVAALLRLFGPPWSRVPLVGYPAFWEIAAAVLLGATAVLLAR